MIISSEEWLNFIKDGQKYTLEKIEEIFSNEDEEVE